MTWKEFKKTVDDQLKEMNIDESVEIWYIDMSFNDDLRIEMDSRDGTLAIWN